jgi:hypothetical protein
MRRRASAGGGCLRVHTWCSLASKGCLLIRGSSAGVLQLDARRLGSVTWLFTTRGGPRRCWWIWRSTPRDHADPA